MKNYTITVNGNVYEVSVEENTGSIQPTTVATPVAQPAAQASKPVAQAQKEVSAPKPSAPTPAPAAGAAGSFKVNSPMPGKIIGIKAQVGQAIKKGQVILILEAMKMENEIVAPQDGTIASINVTEGHSVQAGDLLASLN